MLKENCFLESLGLVLFKTTNYKVLHDLDNVMKELEQFIVERFVLKND